MILAKTANESIFFSVFYHRLKFWILNFNALWLLQKTSAPHGFPFNNVYLYVYYHPSTFVGLVAKHPVYIFTVTLHVFYFNLVNFRALYKQVLFLRTIQCFKAISLFIIYNAMILHILHLHRSLQTIPRAFPKVRKVFFAFIATCHSSLTKRFLLKTTTARKEKTQGKNPKKYLTT